MESNLKRYVLLAKLLQAEVDILETRMIDLKIETSFLIDKILESDVGDQIESQAQSNLEPDIQLDTDLEIQQKEEDNDCKSEVEMLRRKVQELETSNMVLSDKLSEFEWDEETENQLRMVTFRKRRERALLKNKQLFESNRPTCSRASSQSDEGCDCDCNDEID